MKSSKLSIGISLAVGAYIYEVINNLLEKQPLSSALADLDWKRVIFIGVFGSVIYYFYHKNSDRK